MSSVKRVILIAALASAALGLAAVSRASSSKGPILVPACPSRAPKPVSTGAATRHFVRPGASEMRICRYYGVNWGFPNGLRQQRLIRAPLTISRITRTFNGLREARPGIFCVRDDGTELLVVFAYSRGGAERVVVKLSGCRFAMNGHSTRWTTPRLQHRLVNLVKRH